MKKLLLFLLVGFFGLGCFCSAGTFTYSGTLTSSTGIPDIQVPISSPSTDVSVACVFQIDQDGGNLRFTPYFSYYYGNLYYANTYTFSAYNVNGNQAVSFDYDFSSFSDAPSWASPYRGPSVLFFRSYYLSDGFTATYSCTFEGPTVIDISGGGDCPEVNTGEILSGYILESEIDTNYCVENGYCPNECGSGTDFSGDLQYSNIYINSILHPGRQNIFVDIPDYITWDYSSTGDDFNLYVGSGYDVDYINSIIDINSYRPDSKDFTDIFVGGLTLIVPYIVVILFFIIIWKLLKKIFS